MDARRTKARQLAEDLVRDLLQAEGEQNPHRVMDRATSEHGEDKVIMAAILSATDKIDIADGVIANFLRSYLTDIIINIPEAELPSSLSDLYKSGGGKFTSLSNQVADELGKIFSIDSGEPSILEAKEIRLLVEHFGILFVDNPPTPEGVARILSEIGKSFEERIVAAKKDPRILTAADKIYTEEAAFNPFQDMDGPASPLSPLFIPSSPSGSYHGGFPSPSSPVGSPLPLALSPKAQECYKFQGNINKTDERKLNTIINLLNQLGQKPDLSDAEKRLFIKICADLSDKMKRYSEAKRISPVDKEHFMEKVRTCELQIKGWGMSPSITPNKSTVEKLSSWWKKTSGKDAQNSPDPGVAQAAEPGSAPAPMSPTPQSPKSPKFK